MYDGRMAREWRDCVLREARPVVRAFGGENASVLLDSSRATKRRRIVLIAVFVPGCVIGD